VRDIDGEIVNTWGEATSTTGIWVIEKNNVHTEALKGYKNRGIPNKANNNH